MASLQANFAEGRWEGDTTLIGVALGLVLVSCRVQPPNPSNGSFDQGGMGEAQHACPPPALWHSRRGMPILEHGGTISAFLEGPRAGEMMCLHLQAFLPVSRSLTLAPCLLLSCNVSAILSVLILRSQKTS